MESELLKTIQSNKLSADLLYKNKFYTQATTLYFKTLFSVCDYVILKSTGNAPKSHVERFSAMKTQFPDLYLINDKYFPIYQQTYTSQIDKPTCDIIKQNVEKLIKEKGIQI